MLESVTTIERLHTLFPSFWELALVYTFACLMAITQVRAIRLDRRAARKPSLTRRRLQCVAFWIAAPTAMLCFYVLLKWPLDVSVIHSAFAGFAAPAIARGWISVLERYNPQAAALFKVSDYRRAEDVCQQPAPDSVTKVDPHGRGPDDTFQEL